jgi:hypothetical protein
METPSDIMTGTFLVKYNQILGFINQIMFGCDKIPKKLNQSVFWECMLHCLFIVFKISLFFMPSSHSLLWLINIHLKGILPFPYSRVNRGQYSGLDQFQTRVLVNHDGRVQWMGPSLMRTSCQVDIKMFPFDTQVHLSLRVLYIISY